MSIGSNSINTASDSLSSFTRGPHTMPVPAALFSENRARLIDALRSALGAAGAVIVLEGGKSRTRFNTDTDEFPLRQESYFFWAFGVHEPDCYAAIDVGSGRSVLYPPRLSPDYAIWDGRIEPESYFQKKYCVDQVVFHDGTAIAAHIRAEFKPTRLLLLRAENTDSGLILQPANFPGIDRFSEILDTDKLYPVMAELRVFKTDRELEVLRYASKVANRAHMELMHSIRPGMYEYQLESQFRHISHSTGGCRHLSYTCIGATGQNGAILHYGGANAPNEKLINDGDMCVFDMGPEYCCYASDVTCSFPVNGKFTDKQRMVYEAVLDANLAVFRGAKPGVRWTDMHLLAERTILGHLLKAGLLRGDIDQMMAHRLCAIFMPHGLGHFMGIDVHDVGGYLGDALPRGEEPGLKCLRTTRTLAERMVITIEPGCYFIDTLLDRALSNPDQSQFIVAERLAEFRGFGGVRIEDDIVIWAGGNENMNIELPRTVEQIELFMATARSNTNDSKPFGGLIDK